MKVAVGEGAGVQRREVERQAGLEKVLFHSHIRFHSVFVPFQYRFRRAWWRSVGRGLCILSMPVEQVAKSEEIKTD